MLSSVVGEGCRGCGEEIQDRLTQLCGLHTRSQDVERKYKGSIPETCSRRYCKFAKGRTFKVCYIGVTRL